MVIVEPGVFEQTMSRLSTQGREAVAIAGELRATGNPMEAGDWIGYERRMEALVSNTQAIHATFRDSSASTSRRMNVSE